MQWGRIQMQIPLWFTVINELSPLKLYSVDAGFPKILMAVFLYLESSRDSF